MNENESQTTEWSSERVAEQFRSDVRERFEAENAVWLKVENEEIAKAKLERPGLFERNPDYIEVRNSFYWEIYSASKIEIENNSVRVVLPNFYAIYPDFVKFFGKTSVGWSSVSISAEVFGDDGPRVVLELFLIDYWDDERHAKWLAENPNCEEP